MDLRVAIAIPKACAGHARHISLAFSRPVLQKQIGRLPTLSVSKGKSGGVSPRQLVVKAASSGGYQFSSGDSNIVDANMILLRKRMVDLKMQETNYMTPEEYTGWEKKLYPAYHAHVFMAMAWLQCSLINTRPIVAITLFIFISATVSSSIVMLSVTPVSCVSQIVTEFLSSLHG